jgi:hypothetical protein
MGTVFGRVGVEEPVYQVLLAHTGKLSSYEIRKYGQRFAAETAYPTGNNDDGSPFMILAKYIGVFGDPANEGDEKISMTAPVTRQGGGEAIAMTAPVVRSEDSGTKKMQFMLPAKYDDISKIPKPTDPRVTITEIPASVGAVHRFNGSFEEQRCQKMISNLVQQLREDGVDVTEVELSGVYHMGYNPPWTIPYFKRNEVWIPLTQAQVDHLLGEFGPN